jgi:hypothetical protein
MEMAFEKRLTMINYFTCEEEKGVASVNVLMKFLNSCKNETDVISFIHITFKIYNISSHIKKIIFK